MSLNYSDKYLDKYLDNSLIKDLQERENKILCRAASFDSDALRRKKEKRDIRSEFSRDGDRIIHSFCYTRYIDKTQVFYRERDKASDQISHRVIHVQLLSKISRFVGRCLGLNEDLIEAISLGHDVGHPPFGHVGEKALSEIYHKYDKKHYFHHNLQSVVFLDKLEKRVKGKEARGLNLTIQTLDGILCHNGEIGENKIKPDTDKNPERKWEIFDIEAEKIHLNKEAVNVIPMTLEGCLVRFVDTISYIGRDLEDAVNLGYLKRNEIPETVLGNDNRKILNTLVRDLIKESKGKNYIAYSDKVFDALCELKKFNYENIYESKKVRGDPKKIKDKIEAVFKYFLDEINNKNSLIHKDHIKLIGDWYFKENIDKPYVIVKDYVAGMTDRYFKERYEEI